MSREGEGHRTKNRYQLKQMHINRLRTLITEMLDAKIFVSRERRGASSRKCAGIKVQHGLLTLALSEKFAGFYLPRAARFDPVFSPFHNIVRNEVTLDPSSRASREGRGRERERSENS